MSAPQPTASIHLREHASKSFWEAKFRYQGVPVKRRIGPAWLGRGRVQPGFYDERRAHAEAARIVREYVQHAHEYLRERARPATFRDVALDYLRWLEKVRGAKPSTLVDHRSVLGDHRPIMQAIGATPAERVTVRDVESILARVAETASPRTTNKHRAVMSAVFNYARKASTFNLAGNPASEADCRREPARRQLVYYTPQEIERLADAMGGTDGEMVRVSAYAGCRQGELLALRPEDIDLDGRVLAIRRALSASVEASTKSGKDRRVPLPEQAAQALTRSKPTGPRIYNADPSALRRRLKRAQKTAGLRPLRWHDLRHTYGSLLAASGVDLVTIQAAMGHSSLTTTGRYLHARPAHEQAAVFTRAFAA